MSAVNPPTPSSVTPDVVQLVGHQVRWQLLGELSRSDLRVGELVDLVGQPQNLVSYHLRKLRAGGLVSVRRSTADGRDSYYRLELARCGARLADAGAALHPGLRLLPTPAPEHYPAGCRVLFLCTGNSARSQLAEAFLRTMTDGAVDAASAGSRPKPLHRHAVKVLAERGIDISGNRTKHLDEFAGQRFDAVVTLCDRVREVCPEFPGVGRTAHWSVPDPAATGDLAAFRDVAAELEERVRFLLPVLADSRSPEVTQ